MKSKRTVPGSPKEDSSHASPRFLGAAKKRVELGSQRIPASAIVPVVEETAHTARAENSLMLRKAG
eukprot:4472170-Prymnesium_polylepis.1